MMCVGADMESSRRAIKLAEQYDFIYAAVGVHPHDAENMTEADIDTLRKWAGHERVKAIGEIGLRLLLRQFAARYSEGVVCTANAALRVRFPLPVIIHDRDAHGDCMEILRRERVDLTGGVFHCYSGSAEMAKEALNLGCICPLPDR